MSSQERIDLLGGTEGPSGRTEGAARWKKGMCKKGHWTSRAPSHQQNVEWITPRKGPSKLLGVPQSTRDIH